MAIDVNQEHEDSLNKLEKVGLVITKAVGTMWCAIIFALLALVSLPTAINGGIGTTISWIAQTFLQLVLLSVIMVGQDLQNRHSERRADAMFELTKKIDELLENQNNKQ